MNRRGFLKALAAIPVVAYVGVRLNRPSRTLHAAPKARGRGDGTPDNPMDLTTAMNRCGAGDTVMLEAGVYDAPFAPKLRGVIFPTKHGA